jgi:hypothetical protein
MRRHIPPHKLADDLRRRFILRTADFEEAVPQIALYPDAKAHVFLWHSASVAIGYTIE